MKAERVSDLMARDVAVIRSDSDVHELEKLLLERKIHGMPVVDEGGRIVGVVSQTDLLLWHYMSGVDGATFYDASTLLFTHGGESRSLGLSDIRTASVSEVMSPVVHCIQPDEPIALAAARMIERRVHRLVVVDAAAQVLGIISATDLLRAIPGVADLAEKIENEARYPVRAAEDRPTP